MDRYIEEYGKRLYGLCMHLTKNRHDADDLYQETWLKAIRSFKNYDSGRDFGSWIGGICVNAYKDIYRRKKISPFFDFFRSNDEKDLIIESSPFINEDYSDLTEAVNGLEEKLRVTVILYYYNGFNQQQTADMLKIPLGTVKSRLNAARKKLKEAMTDEG